MTNEKPLCPWPEEATAELEERCFVCHLFFPPGEMVDWRPPKRRIDEEVGHNKFVTGRLCKGCSKLQKDGA